MLNYKIILIFLVILFQQNFAKTFSPTDSTKTGSIKISKQQQSKHLSTLNLLNFNEQKSKKHREQTLIIPKNSVLNWKLLELELSQNLYFNNNYNKKFDDFEYSKKKLQKFLALKYKEIPNYDLGKFGQYLGIIKKIFAMILGIISLL